MYVCVRVCVPDTSIVSFLPPTPRFNQSRRARPGLVPFQSQSAFPFPFPFPIRRHRAAMEASSSPPTPALAAATAATGGHDQDDTGGGSTQSEVCVNNVYLCLTFVIEATQRECGLFCGRHNHVYCCCSCSRRRRRRRCLGDGCVHEKRGVDDDHS